MAIMKMYSVKDEKVNTFGVPFCQPNDVQASRMLSRAVNDKDLQLSMYPEDFSLYQIAIFDDEDGKVTANQPKLICSAISLKKLAEKND